MDIDIDVSEVLAFGDRISGATVDRELTATAGAVLAEGVGLAAELAPRDQGTLANSIAIIDGPSASGGSFGTSLVYAWMREEGGTITGNPWLVFQVNGRWVKVRQVTQSGSHYMAQAAEQLAPRAEQAYGMAVDRILEAA